MKLKFLLLIVGLNLVAACGTISNAKSVKDDSSRPNLKAYTHVYVEDFGDNTTEGEISTNFIKKEGKKFADMIARRISMEGKFDEVLREVPLKATEVDLEKLETLETSSNKDTKILKVSGNITRYDEGNPTMRMLIGFGAGSSYFDAEVDFVDYSTDNKLGNMIVDKNSWALGGTVAMSQNVSTFMEEGAEVIAEEITKAKIGELGTQQE